MSWGIAKSIGVIEKFAKEVVINAVLQKGIYNKNNTEVVIGLWKNGDGYTKLGRSTGKTFLDVPKEVLEEYEKRGFDWWSLNKKFLDEQIEANKTFILETPYNVLVKETKNGAGENFMKEIQYFLDKGYRFTPDETKLIPGADIWDITPMWNW